MFAQFSNPHCGNWGRQEPKPCSSKAAQDQQQNPFDNLNLADIIEHFAATASLAEPWISAQFGKPETAKCSKAGNAQTVATTENKFEVKVDVTNFAQNEINVKVVDNSIVVGAKHEEKEDKHGFISRQFSRRFVLPEGVILEKMECKMISDTVILISAPRAVEKATPNEKSIPINIIGQSSNSTAPETDSSAAPQDISEME